ncbi:MAG TPA: nucleotidyltransferase family protein [Gammaproteobacteria bacterium]
MTVEIIGILLAAGHSTRFGGNKLLQPLPDTQIAMAVQAARTLCEVLPDSVAVVRDSDRELQLRLLETGIRVVENPDSHLGMSRSIRRGIENPYVPNASGWVIALADMPYIPALVIQQVVGALLRGALIAAPQFKKQRGHPVGFSRPLKAELLQLQGDTGAKPVIDKYRSQIQLIDTFSDAILRDIDYPQDVSK